jgi:hypothetical protein
MHSVISKSERDGFVGPNARLRQKYGLSLYRRGLSARQQGGGCRGWLFWLSPASRRYSNQQGDQPLNGVRHICLQMKWITLELAEYLMKPGSRVQNKLERLKERSLEAEEGGGRPASKNRRRLER